jgi:peptidoglycan-N-acetylglucosamine deacetylase
MALNDSPRPSSRCSAFCTTSWDDGHPLDQRIAELLSKYGLTGTFYIPMQNSRPVMSASEVQQLSGSFEIGAHTVNHVVLTEVAEETAEKQIHESKKRIEDLTGSPCEAFCFPKGRFHRSHVEMVRRAGFRCARTVELLSTRFPVHRSGIDLIATTVQASPHPWIAYVKNSVKRHSPRNMANFLLYARTRNWAETALSMLQVVTQRGGVFHLWGHSWEVEERQQWMQLESVFREMHALGAVPCVTNSRLVSSQHR